MLNMLPESSTKDAPSAELPVNYDGLNINQEILSDIFNHHDLDHDVTPMFDELDLVLDGNNVNGEEDWVALFEPSTDGNEKLALVTDSQNPLSTDVTDFELDVKTDEIEHASITSIAKSPLMTPEVSKKRRYDSISSNSNVNPQLFTPNPSSTLPTPLLDSKSSSKKLDHLGCVSYSKKQRTQPLPKIELDPNADPTAVKRAKNTEAARRSRARKLERMTQLEDKVESLIGEKVVLELEVERLKSLLMENGINF